MQKSSTSTITAPYYDSIEVMPIWNWNKIMETGDLKYLFISGGRVSSKCKKIWNDLQDEYFTEFGVDESYKRKLRLMKEVVNLNDQFIQTKDRQILNFINIAEHDIRGLSITNSLKFYDLLDKVMSVRKMIIDPKRFSVIQWYYALKNLSNGKAD
jgi:hypothetical protein